MLVYTSIRSPADARLSLAERKVLTVLAQYPQGRTKTQVALLTGYSVQGGGFGNALSALRSKGVLPLLVVDNSAIHC